MEAKVTVTVRVNPPAFRAVLPLLPPRATGKKDDEEWQRWQEACTEVMRELAVRRYRIIRPCVLFIVWRGYPEGSRSKEMRDPDQVDVRTVVNELIRWGVIRNDTAEDIDAVVCRAELAAEPETEIWAVRSKEAPEIMAGILGLS